MDWVSFVSVFFGGLILFASIIGGYAVLRKRVKDLEDETDEKLAEKDHKKLCKIATFEMKEHVSDSMKSTMDEFDEKTFQPAMTQILNAINGDK